MVLVSVKSHLLEILLLFFIILSTGTNNEQPSLRLCEGFWTVYKPNILGKPNKGLGAIWNDKVWDIYTHEGIIQAKKIDLGNLRLLESYPELVWQIVGRNENDFEVVIRNDKECAVWTKREDFKKEKEENEQAQVLKNVKKEKKENEQAQDLKKSDLTIAIGEKFLVHEKFSMFDENLWFLNGDIVEIQDLLPDGHFIFKTNEKFNLFSNITEFRKLEKKSHLKQLPNSWTYEFASKRYKQGAILLDVNSTKMNDIFEVKYIDQEWKLCLLKYSVTIQNSNDGENVRESCPNLKRIQHFINQNIVKIFLNSKTMERFHPLPFSPKNMMSKFMARAPEILEKYFLPCLSDYELFMLSTCFGEIPEFFKFQNSIKYKSLCISQCQKIFLKRFHYTFFIDVEKGYKLKASNFPFRKFKLVLESRSYVWCWFLKFSPKNGSYTYLAHTENHLMPGEGLKFNGNGISWDENYGRKGHVNFPVDDEEIFMRIEADILHGDISFILETYWDFQF